MRCVVSLGGKNAHNSRILSYDGGDFGVFPLSLSESEVTNLRSAAKFDCAEKVGESICVPLTTTLVYE